MYMMVILFFMTINGVPVQVAHLDVKNFPNRELCQVASSSLTITYQQPAGMEHTLTAACQPQP